MKIVQLPIEYLWLTHFYVPGDMMEPEYVKPANWLIEHPECLTTEDVAASSGASGDRQAKF